ncbi:hypothetical protein L218DRAFT_947379 [Marasmius fiardii PR-910]|nr:hypothetical protein L218DRAFT_947379 [Marasmius fiardii PR-910]
MLFVIFELSNQVEFLAITPSQNLVLILPDSLAIDGLYAYFKRLAIFGTEKGVVWDCSVWEIEAFGRGQNLEPIEWNRLFAALETPTFFTFPSQTLEFYSPYTKVSLPDETWDILQWCPPDPKLLQYWEHMIKFLFRGGYLSNHVSLLVDWLKSFPPTYSNIMQPYLDELRKKVFALEEIEEKKNSKEKGESIINKCAMLDSQFIHALHQSQYGMWFTTFSSFIDYVHFLSLKVEKEDQNT